MKLTISENCVKLLTKSQDYHWMYGDDLANHLPMALIALGKMKASNIQMQKFYNGQIKKLTLRQKSTIKLEGNWLKNLGDINYYEAYLSYFRHKLKSNNIQTVLEYHLNALIKGVASYAFHAMIHLAYAVESGLKTEVAQALAFWSSGYQSYGDISGKTELNLNQILNDIKPIAEGEDFSFGNITDRMAKVSKLKGLTTAKTQPISITLDLIAELAINSFNETRNFTLLHVVTGTQAMRVIMPFVKDKESMIRYYWHTIVIAYITTLNTPSISRKTNKLTSWEFIIDRAKQANNEHDIKLVYSSYIEYQRTHNEMYLNAVNHLFI